MSESFPARAIAVVGMAGRFPDARTVDALWANVRDGVELISFFSEEALLAAGVSASDLAHPRYVRAAPLIEGATEFDAEFFKYGAQEVELIDPQQRLFLECAVEALEHAGCDPARYPGAIGVFGGVGTNTYKYGLWSKHKAELRSSIAFEVLFMGGNDSDFLTTRVSYKLGLSGPSITTQTACSSSLVAVHMACQSLFSGEADMALAGGSSILRSYFKSGYRYEPGGIASPDGHCRPFDACARGTNFGDGVGLVVLKRLDEALRDGDCVHAVIRGTAINNDGSTKVGYNAPSVDGQAAVISEALAVSGVSAETIRYVETHGTGTELGDPIEIAALTKAFRAETDAAGFCAVGSIKSNIGHLGAASGIAGLIKVVLMLKHGVLPPTLHFRSPNPNIPFAGSPFYVNAHRAPWHSNGTPRRAGVSSFGVGGTNAHVVLEQAPTVVSSPSRRTWHVLPLSTASPRALKAMSDNLASNLSGPEETLLADVAYTLAAGRAVRAFRRAIVCHHSEVVADVVRRSDAQPLIEHGSAPRPSSVVFMFPSGSSCTLGLGRDLYEGEPSFKREVDRCTDAFRSLLGVDIRDVLLADTRSGASFDVDIAEVAVFATSYAIAQVWSTWGVRPRAVIGEGVGELVAACVAGVFGVEDALRLVAEHARSLDSSDDVRAAVASSPATAQAHPSARQFTRHERQESWNTPTGSGAICALEPQLTTAGAHSFQPNVPPTHHASTTARTMSSVTPTLSAACETAGIRIISSATGAWADANSLCGTEYWSCWPTRPACLEKGIRTLLDSGYDLFVEVGPASTLTDIARSLADGSRVATFTALTTEDGRYTGAAGLYQATARLWEVGGDVFWEKLYEGERRSKVPLPTYPFERKSYGADIAAHHLSGAAESDESEAPHDEDPTRSTNIQTVVVKLWSELSGQKNLSSHDDLAEVGSDSLTMLRLIGRLSDALGVDIPIGILTEARTLADLSQQIEGLLSSRVRTRRTSGTKVEKSVEGLVLLQSGSSPPLVFIHPIGGGVQCYEPLVRCLPDDQTIYAIHAFGRSSDRADRRSVETIAQAYLGLIRNVWESDAPPRLLGWSFGGTVAFEMARQLAEAGTPTQFVGLIDSQLPDRQARSMPDDEQLRSQFQMFVQREAELGTGKHNGFEANTRDTPAFEAFRAHCRALYAYQPKPIGMVIRVFHACDQSAIGDGWASPWADSSTEGCEYIAVPGDHFTIMENPNVEIVGRQLMQRLGTAG